MQVLVYRNPRGIGPQRFNSTNSQREAPSHCLFGLWWEAHLLTVFIPPSAFGTFFLINYNLF